MVGDYLKMHGFNVTLCDGGKSLRGAIESGVPDLVVLDLNMPEETGFRSSVISRAAPNIPLSCSRRPRARSTGVGRARTRRRRYVAKPCELRELMARIRSVLRRSSPVKAAPAATEAASAKSAKDQLVRFGPNGSTSKRRHFATTRQRASPDRVRIRAPESVSPPIRSGVVARALLELANARDAEAFDRAVDLRIMRIRRKIEPDPAKPAVIRTIRGGGYLFSPSEKRPDIRELRAGSPRPSR